MADDYVSRTMARESGGNARAKNPNSSATGLFQFTRGTWENYMRKYPELGLTKDGIYDPAQQQRAMQAYTNDTRNAYKQLGIQPTDQNLYAGHFLGQAGAVRFLTNTAKNPMAPAYSFVDDASVKANRSIFFNKDGSPKAAYEVYGDFGSKHGGWTPNAKPQEVTSGYLQAQDYLSRNGEQGYTPKPVKSFDGYAQAQNALSNNAQQRPQLPPNRIAGNPNMGYQSPNGGVSMPSMPPPAQPLAPLPTTVIPSERPIVDPQAMPQQAMQQPPMPQKEAPYEWADDRGGDNPWSPRVAASGNNGRGFFSLFS
jgi:hypothetical protein